MQSLHKVTLVIASVLCSSSLLGNTDERVTVFIHGTLPPLVSSLVHIFDAPLGVTPAIALKNQLMLSRIGHTLDKADAKKFPLKSCYLFGWSGNLSVNARKIAAIELYDFLKTCKHKHISLIGHSHGGNVALHLAEIAKQNNDDQLRIEKLVLLACPVQKVTEQFISSPLFKKIYSLHCPSDVTQIADIQLFSHYNSMSKMRNRTSRFFSRRIFDGGPNIIQARILFNKKDLWHIDFMRTAFLWKLPAVLDILDSADTYLKSMHTNGIFSVNIPSNGAPHLLLADQLPDETSWLTLPSKIIEYLWYGWLMKKSDK